MKQIVYLIIFFFTVHTAGAQEEQPGAARLKAKMIEYVQGKLGLNKAEASRFEPLYRDYLQELRDAKRTYKDDRLLLQQKVIDIRLRLRNQLKPLVGEKRSNDVFTYERQFVQQVQEVRKERRQERRQGFLKKRNNFVL